MKRDEIKPGGEYADTLGNRIRVHDLDPGWGVVDGEWVERKSIRRRYVKGAWADFQSNFYLRAEVRRGRRWVKVVVLPRNLICPWKEHQRLNGDLLDQQARAAALAKAWEKALAHKGLDVLVDPANQTCVVDVETLGAALGVQIEE